jgi:hypothetical protein
MKNETKTEISAEPTETLLMDWTALASRNRFQCPHCSSIVYSRKSRFCGVCGSNLPSNFLFSASERSGLKNMLAAERSRHRAWLERRAD